MAVGDVTVKRIVGPVLLTTTSGAVFTVPANKRYTITSMIVHNSDTATDKTFQISIGAAASSTLLFSESNLAPSETVIVEVAITLEAGEALHGRASVLGYVSLTVNGWDEETS